MVQPVNVVGKGFIIPCSWSTSREWHLPFLRQTKEEGEGELREMCIPQKLSGWSLYGRGECEAELQRVLVPPGVLISGENRNRVNYDRKFGTKIRACSGEKGQ